MPPKPNSGTAKAKALAAPDTLTPASSPVDPTASVEVATGSDAVSVPSAEPLTGLAIGTELLCDPFENGAAVLGTVTAIEGDEVKLTLADFGTTWPVDLDCIELDGAGTWTHAPEDYPAPGAEPTWDAEHRPWLGSKPVEVAAVTEGAESLKDAAAQFGRLADAADRLAEIVAPLVGLDGEAVDVPLATTPPQLAEPDSIVPTYPSPEELRASTLETLKAAFVVEPAPASMAADVLHDLVEELSTLEPATPAPAPLAANHPGAGWVLCKVNGPGTISGSWIRQDTGNHSSVARTGDIGFFTEATLTKFESIGHADLLKRL